MSVMNDMEEEMYQLRITIDNLKQQRDELQHQLAGMTDSAKHFSNGMEYYRGLIGEAAKSIGIAMYTADDQGVHPDPLYAKLPECVAELVQQRDDLLAAAVAVRADLVRRAEFDSEDGGAVLNISNGVLMQLDAAIAKVKEQK